MTVLLGDGDLDFVPGSPFHTGDQPSLIHAGDMDEDGHLDLVVRGGYGFYLRVFPGDGLGRFRSCVPLEVGPGPSTIEAIDLDGDGHLDLAVGHEREPGRGLTQISVRRGGGDGTFRAVEAFSLQDEAFDLVTGDLNRDQIPDLAVALQDTSAVELLLGEGAGPTWRLVEGGLIHLDFQPRHIVLADLDEDGSLDLVVGARDRPGNGRPGSSRSPPGHRRERGFARRSPGGARRVSSRLAQRPPRPG